MERSAKIFCAASLAGCLLIAAIAFPFAAKTTAEITKASTPLSPEQFDDIDLGEFGQVSVLDLMQYYIDNPPPAPEPGAAPRKVRFQGC